MSVAMLTSFFNLDCSKEPAVVQLVEMDENTTFLQQLATLADEPVVLLNIFTVPPEDEASFLALWSPDAEYMLANGAVSGQLHKGVEGSRSYLNYAVWESGRALAASFRSPEFQALLARYPASVTASPHVFRKIAIPGICTA